MNYVTWIGLGAAACTTFAYLPQVLKSWKTKHTADLSLMMYSLMTTGMLLWLIYGIFRKDIALISANSLSLLLSGSVLYLKLRYGVKK